MKVNFRLKTELKKREYRRKNYWINGPTLGVVAEIEAQMFSFAYMFNRRTAVDFSTEPAILPNCC